MTALEMAIILVCQLKHMMVEGNSKTPKMAINELVISGMLLDGNTKFYIVAIPGPSFRTETYRSGPTIPSNKIEKLKLHFAISLTPGML